MINQLHSCFNRPEKGWDPVPRQCAKKYAVAEWRNFDSRAVDCLEKELYGLEGKRVLDLGGGPGQYSVEFAKRGALVTWHDISRNYQEIASEKANENRVSIDFSLGYLEEAIKFKSDPFDLVFSRICWCYCQNDLAFSKIFYSIIKPDGAGYIDTNPAEAATSKGFQRTQILLNNFFYFKIGHPYPPHGRIEKLFRQYPHKKMIADYSSPKNDRIFFVKADN